MLFKRVALEVSLDKKVIRVNEVMDLNTLYLSLEDYFKKNGIHSPIKRENGLNEDKITLLDGWTFHPKTIDLYKQKDNSRYRHWRTSDKDWLKSEWKKL